jgi:mRNA-degrading endonuclease RelE of RelBE toxin-antitoxin system
MIAFIEHPAFTRFIQDWLKEDDYREFQLWLAENPDAGDVIPGMAGLRKVRMALPGRGKRGGARVLYLHFRCGETIFLVYAYTKGDVDDMPTDKRKAVKQLVEEIKREFE